MARFIIVIPSLLVWLYRAVLRTGAVILYFLVTALKFELDLVATKLENISSRPFSDGPHVQNSGTIRCE